MTLVFVHIPKTGGLSLYNELSQWIKPAIRFGNQKTYKQFFKMTSSELKKYKLVSGHIYLKSFRQKEIEGPAFTILRNPIDQIISAYRYLNSSDHPDHADLKFSDLNHFIDYLEGNYNNMQCRFFSGSPSFENAVKVIDQENIFPFPLEYYSQFITYLSMKLQIPLKVRHANQSPKGNIVEFNDHQKNRIQELIAEDNKLYEYVANKYEFHQQRFTSVNAKYFEQLAMINSQKTLVN